MNLRLTPVPAHAQRSLSACVAQSGGTYSRKEGLAHAQGKGDALRILAVVLLLGPGLLALVDLEPGELAAQCVAKHVQLKTYRSWLAQHNY
eukprot:3169622-Pleurochrysis_carterae.AAC.1